jgi:hypothetical protein
VVSGQLGGDLLGFGPVIEQHQRAAHAFQVDDGERCHESILV